MYIIQISCNISQLSIVSRISNFLLYFLLPHLSDICKRNQLKGHIFCNLHGYQNTKNLYSSSLCDVTIEHRAPAISRECLYSTIFRLRFIARLSRLSNCSLDFSQPLVFIALSSRTLSPKGASRPVEILMCACAYMYDYSHTFLNIILLKVNP